MRLDKDVGVADAEEAKRLFKISTLDAAQSGFVTAEGDGHPDKERIYAIERIIERLVSSGNPVNVSSVIARLEKSGYLEPDVRFAIRVLVTRNKIEYGRNGKSLVRA
eukprot:TRINITY_DN34345_c0_g1_i1.p2 TRINITY_DN34345_c0_g1~~TRINITY_DN34345_c0_g1_i1.p2  ORF type:complete len:107 (+),score=30.56 TRINITY_DN34345_c0_g1_i1:97-417(+)